MSYHSEHKVIRASTPHALGMLLVLSFISWPNETSTPQLDPEIVPSYEDAWDKGRELVRLSEIQAAVEELDSASDSVRTQALETLHSITGLECPHPMPEMAILEMRELTSSSDEFMRIAQGEYVLRPEEHKQLWSKYAANLDLAVREKVPGLLVVTTMQNDMEKIGNLKFIGEEAPHPAFLPLIREIVANPDELEYVRRTALLVITYIPQDGIIEYLMGFLGTEFDRNTREYLSRLTGTTADKLTANGKTWREGFNDWWAKNKESYKYDRAEAFKHGF